MHRLESEYEVRSFMKQHLGKPLVLLQSEATLSRLQEAMDTLEGKFKSFHLRYRKPYIVTKRDSMYHLWTEDKGGTRG